MITNRKSTMIAPAYTRIWMIAMNCALRARYSKARQKKFTIRKRTLMIGFRRVTIRIAEAIATPATTKRKTVSKFIHGREISSENTSLKIAKFSATFKNEGMIKER
jgi:hypothetical protein